MSKAKLILGLAGLAAGYGLYRASHPRIPSHIRPVADFDLNRYLGRWYEIARLENRFEKGLIQTRAEYSLRWNGSVRVVNSGFDPWQSRIVKSVGTARFQRSNDIAALKVSFFSPFYGGYNIVDLDRDYRWAIVVGSSRRYFWALSREPLLDEELRLRIVSRAVTLGIRPSELVWVPHDVPETPVLAEMGNWVEAAR